MERLFVVKKVKEILIEARVWQWVKNFLVFLPLVFSSRAFVLVDLERVLIAFLSFCFAASFVYIMNDVFDFERDKLHPKKKLRPLASGAISLREALLCEILFITLTIALSYYLGITVLGVMLFYIALNIFYSMKMKHYPVIDIGIVALFYLLRVFVGGLVLEVSITSWLLLTTFFMALFVVAGKRRAELISANSNNLDSRRVLGEYNEKFLESVINISLTLFIIFYSLYVVLVHDKPFTITIFITLGIVFRYLYLMYAKGVGEEPERLLLKDKPLMLGALTLVITIIILLYSNPLGLF